MAAYAYWGLVTRQPTSGPSCSGVFGLWNTGVDLDGSGHDQHWTSAFGPVQPYSYPGANAPVYSTWVSDNGSSGSTSTGSPHTYSTTFQCPNTSGAYLVGRLSADDTPSIFLNGNDVSARLSPLITSTTGLAEWHYFQIPASAGIVSGTNTFDVYVADVGNGIQACMVEWCILPNVPGAMSSNVYGSDSGGAYYGNLPYQATGTYAGKWAGTVVTIGGNMDVVFELDGNGFPKLTLIGPSGYGTNVQTPIRWRDNTADFTGTGPAVGLTITITW